MKYRRTKHFQDLSAPEFESYFRGLSRDRTLTDWQFIQAVDTLRILLVNLCKSPLAQHIDWDYWKDSSRSLDAGHGTLAVDNTVDAVLNNRRQVFFPVSAQRHDFLKEMVSLHRNRCPVCTGVRTLGFRDAHAIITCVCLADLRSEMMKMRYIGWVVGLLALFLSARALAEAKFVQTPYTEQKVVFDFYFDDPQKVGPALFWVRALLNPLMDDPYGYAPEFMEIKVILHGMELVTVARHNYEKYRDIVERMRYYSELGVEFRVCAMAATDYGYRLQDFQDFIRVIPSAITELAHWQLQGYALITPQVMDKKYSIEEIR